MKRRSNTVLIVGWELFVILVLSAIIISAQNDIFNWVTFIALTGIGVVQLIGMYLVSWHFEYIEKLIELSGGEIKVFEETPNKPQQD